ncbi:MAG TPA: prephenate dehydratase [Candidatus Altiarchaeales archaeon]|nr:MAG: prephenate dehydratase [Candidatus Altiarchaeales archaeon]HDN83095.1 prephenate dehydratase [Candidatus Altiarchaeales archaeon]
MERKKKLVLLREKIDKIDNEIISLLNKRAKICKEIGKLKQEFGIEEYVPEREFKILEKVESKAKDMPPKYMRSIFNDIISACRSLERKLKVCYLGPEGSFTHLAAREKFGIGTNYIALKTIEDIFEEVNEGKADYGVVPIESSTEGTVTTTLDMFIRYNIKIVGEILLKINHCLLSKYSKDDIKVLYSHPQAFAQCRKWLRENLPNVELRECSSTSEAARIASKEKNSGAIASKIAAEIYSLKVIEEGIQDYKENYTRFLIIGNHEARKSGNDKTSIVFSIKDKAGALYEILEPFAKLKINLTKIESRPSRQEPWDYYFFLDFQGHKDDAKVKKALKEVEEKCVFLKVLGSYPSNL